MIKRPTTKNKPLNDHRLARTCYQFVLASALCKLNLHSIDATRSQISYTVGFDILADLSFFHALLGGCPRNEDMPTVSFPQIVEGVLRPLRRIVRYASKYISKYTPWEKLQQPLLVVMVTSPLPHGPLPSLRAYRESPPPRGRRNFTGIHFELSTGGIHEIIQTRDGQRANGWKDSASRRSCFLLLPSLHGSREWGSRGPS